MERRTLVRLLVGLGIGLPIAIEAATFLGLFESRVLTGGDDGAETPTPSGTPAADAVGIGDDLLPATTQRERLTAAEIRREDGERVFVMTVAVENDTEATYELRLNALTTDAGTTVGGGGRTDRLEPGGSARLTGRWVLPPGEVPAALIVVATVIPPGGDRQTVTRRVRLSLDVG